MHTVFIAFQVEEKGIAAYPGKEAISARLGHSELVSECYRYIPEEYITFIAIASGLLAAGASKRRKLHTRFFG